MPYGRGVLLDDKRTQRDSGRGNTRGVATTIEYLPDRLHSAWNAAGRVTLHVRDWSADGLSVLSTLSRPLNHGLAFREFVAFLSRLGQVHAGPELERAACTFLSQLVDAGFLEICEKRESPADLCIRISNLGQRMLLNNLPVPPHTRM